MDTSLEKSKKILFVFQFALWILQSIYYYKRNRRCKIQNTKFSSKEQILIKEIVKRSLSNARKEIRYCEGSKIKNYYITEAGFSTLYKIVFISRLILNHEYNQQKLSEIIRDRRTQAETHLVLNEMLITDITNIRKLLLLTVYVDTTNYYDRVVHCFAILST